MNADEFDAWLRARGARVATGVPGRPAAAGAVAAAPSVASTMPAGSDPAPVVTTTALPELATSVPEAVPLPPSPPTGDVVVATAPAAPAALPPNDATAVTLQVASFAARANAERALALLHGAGMAQARLVEGEAAGQPVWRLRLGPIGPQLAAELAGRVAGLGFGPPRFVHD